METSRKFTPEELSKFDGKSGRPAYIAYKGNVYDVTDSYLWIDGEHLGEHRAGKDLTQQMVQAPHGEDALEKVKLLGSLIEP